ncbi:MULTISPECIES: hypothetical protein [unclassified Nocardioides]|uniref:hypothetical protein n=1 Tax=unclassified Nocardioides TaxID=2615069 RepID=UPI003612CBD1
MFQRVRTGAVAGIFVMVAVLSVGGAATAEVSTGHADTAVRSAASFRAHAVARPVLRPSKSQVDEGDRFTLTATVKSPKTATRAVLQKWYVPLYYGTPRWEPVKSLRVGGKSQIAFKRVATDENSERYRLVVTYKKTKKPVVSKPTSVTVWRWIPLKEYDPYYASESLAMIFGTATINGVAYSGWGAASYSHTGTWESRFTPGRHCTSFKAILGLGDISADGSSGSVSFTADDKPIYTSPALTPGMSVPVTASLAKPYRFGIQLLDTTPGGTTGRDEAEAWPVLGEPAFLCTGV